MSIRRLFGCHKGLGILGLASLTIGVAACNIERDSEGASPCEQHIDCLAGISASGGAQASAYQATLDQARSQYGQGGACATSPQARQQCDQACTSGLTAVAQAFPSQSACGVKTSPTLSACGGGSRPCKAYLSCVLSSSPTTYGAALTIYGEEAACWDTPAQSASCDTACSASLAQLKDVCACVGNSCTAAAGLMKSRGVCTSRRQMRRPAAMPRLADSSSRWKRSVGSSFVKRLSACRCDPSGYFLVIHAGSLG